MGKILVTGAAGFIGSHLSEKLLQRGDEVVGLDNFDPYYAPSLKRANVSRLEAYSRFRMVEGDVRQRGAMLALFQQERFGGVVHLAAMAGVRNAVMYPDLYVDVDFNGSQHLMDGARFTGVENFIFASTSSVYGETNILPFVETDACDRPLQPYAAAKRAVELLGYTYHRLYQLNFTALRFFTVYGPYNRPDMMAYLVAESVTKGTPVPLYERGEMWRDWTFVGDIVGGVIAALDRPMGYEVINLGFGKPILLREFIELFESLAGQKGNFVPTPKMSADMMKTYADTEKARRLLNYQTKTSIEEGVTAFWQWYRQITS